MHLNTHNPVWERKSTCWQVLASNRDQIAHHWRKSADSSSVERTGEAFIQRYGRARCKCLKSEGIPWFPAARIPTCSPSIEDRNCAVLAVYNSKATALQMYTYLTDKYLSPGPPFVFQKVLQYLWTAPTWSMLLELQEAAKANAESSRTHEEEASSEEYVERAVLAEKCSGSKEVPI